MRVITSQGEPQLASGVNQFTLSIDAPGMGVNEQVLMDHKPFWIESVWRDPEGVLFAWYHHEPWGLCDTNSLTSPVIGAAYSRDEGETWHDLGIVLESPEPPNCEAQNGYFAGGHGDFTVISDRLGRFLYFFFGNYSGELADQGVAVARMATGDRWAPAGAVWKYRAAEWSEPGLGGRATPIFAAKAAWQRENTDAFWGPSIHWNNYLSSYVILMNRTCCAPGWPQEGVYATFNRDLSRPAAWSEPTKILGGETIGWYPQVIGLGPGESDRLAGKFARLYVSGASYWEIEFVRPTGRPARPDQPNRE